MRNKNCIFILGLICLFIIVIKTMQKSSIENFQQRPKPKDKDVIQRITGLRKSNVPYNSNDQKEKILKENPIFYREHRKTLQV